MQSIASPNVKILDFMLFEELHKYMQRAKIYVQVSAHEGFGCSLAEAMLCECLPVVTARGAIPEVIGDSGLYVPVDDPEATAAKIEEAFGYESKGKEARERIKSLFPIEKRERELVEEIESLLNL